MKGTTHLVIGLAIGAAAVAGHTVEPRDAAIFVAVAAFSALAPDLDGTSLLSGKLNGTARMIHALLLWGGLAASAFVGYQYWRDASFDPKWAIPAASAFLLGLLLRNGAIRNGLVGLIGVALLYAGFAKQQGWLMGLGTYVAWVPWLNHRGLSHTVWATAAWGAIGFGLERQLGLDGIAQTAIWGYLSHLIADTLTPSGVKWLYPLTKKTFKLPVGKL